MRSAAIVRLRQVLGLVRRVGVLQTASLVWWRLRHGPGNLSGSDVLGAFSFINQPQRKLAAGPAAKDSLLWFVPDFNIGSGGHLNIFRTIWHMEQKGYACSIVIVRPSVHASAAAARADIRAHFFDLRASVYLADQDLPAAEFAVATSWDTAYWVRALHGTVCKLYFVQDFEPFFYPLGSEYVLAENTYRFGFFGITAGGWLARKLAQDYGMPARAVGFGVELDRYRQLPRREPDVKHVFFYARPPTPRRAFELGLLVLAEVAQRMPDTRFILAGWDTGGYKIPFEHLNCGTLALDELPDLYSQCDVALVLSLTNLSLLPLELMACGCAVVSNRGANVEWLLHEEVALLADATPEALAGAVCGLLADDAGRRALAARAQAFARAQTWEQVAQDFDAGLQAAREAARCVA
ncbi:MAG: glycosyltransferase family 4 protein [Ottowia sp.]|nr:glycosyltransferase family 4 protein [Ottowia sp.]